MVGGHVDQAVGGLNRRCLASSDGNRPREHPLGKMIDRERTDGALSRRHGPAALQGSTPRSIAPAQLAARSAGQRHDDG